MAIYMMNGPFQHWLFLSSPALLRYLEYPQVVLHDLSSTGDDSKNPLFVPNQARETVSIMKKKWKENAVRAVHSMLELHLSQAEQLLACMLSFHNVQACTGF